MSFSSVLVFKSAGRLQNQKMLFNHLLIGGFFILVGGLSLSYCTAELLNITSASQELPTDVELDETYRLMKEGDKKVKLGPERDIVLLLGITGAGKTTLGLLLSTDNNDLISVESSPRSRKFSIVDRNDRISTSILLSQTIFPEKMVDNNGTVYYDCPGFSDTRSLAHDVAASHFIRRVIDYAERLKFLLVIGHDFLESRSTFTDLILHMASHIRNINAFRDGIALVVTKVKQGTYEDDDGNLRAVPDEKEIQEIAKYLMSVKKTFQDSKRNSTHISDENLQKYELATQYIDILLQKSDCKYIKIGIFRSASKAAPLSKIKSLQTNKLDLRNLIENHLKYTVKKASDFNIYTVSERARYSIGKSIENLQKRAELELQNISGKSNKFYAQQEDGLTDVFQFTDEIRQHFQVWTNYQNNNGDNVTVFYDQLRKAIQQLNVTACEENLQKFSILTEYIDMWNSVLPDMAITFRDKAIIWKSILDPFQKRINETMRWYDNLLEFNQLLASNEVQSQRKQLVQIYGYQNANRYHKLQPKNNAMQLDSSIVPNQIAELSIGLSNHRSSLLNDIWDNSMQPVSQTLDAMTNTLRIQGFHLMLSDVKEIIKSYDYNRVRNYELFALDTILIDDDIILTNNNNLVIIAPVWIVEGSRLINLDGKDAEKYSQAATAGDGRPGRAGQSAGNFLGVPGEIKNSQMLYISVVGGNGGDGQNGASGSPGEKGPDFYRLILFSPSESYPGTPGTAGGNGGAGGCGGYCGDVQLMIESEQFSESMISISSCGAGSRGADGEDGLGGSGGRGGQYGDTVIKLCGPVCGILDAQREKNNKYAESGANGIDGINKNNMEMATQTPAINKAASLNNYIFFLRASLNGKRNIPNFKNLREKFEELIKKI